MADIAKRFIQNPILRPGNIRPSASNLEVVCLLNPGAFRFNDKIWLLVRVAERPPQRENQISFATLSSGDELNIHSFELNDPHLKNDDSRVINYKGSDFLTTLSHLRLLCSEDGYNFYEPEDPTRLSGIGSLETYGIEDCRVTQIGEKFWLTYTAVSESGVAVGLRTTIDWVKFELHGLIFPPHNKDCTLFPEKINGKYYALHRPSSPAIGGNYIWLAESPDGINWGKHQCILKRGRANGMPAVLAQEQLR